MSSSHFKFSSQQLDDANWNAFKKYPHVHNMLLGAINNLSETERMLSRIKSDGLDKLVCVQVLSIINDEGKPLKNPG